MEAVIWCNGLKILAVVERVDASRDARFPSKATMIILITKDIERMIKQIGFTCEGHAEVQIKPRQYIHIDNVYIEEVLFILKNAVVAHFSGKEWLVLDGTINKKGIDHCKEKVIFT